VEQTREHDSSPALVHALLGPTNTGKTHRAIERMLDFETGMMGLPLRLLAREVYDRVSTRIGEQAVALVTGEEKRIPLRPRYWICTVEAMPPGLPVDFLAVDEIQLVAHPERGHVFTDRLLSWRGRCETWFLGSDTIERFLREQLRTLHVERLPRLSRLRCSGQASVRTLPRRSAVVAFSMQQVYQLADVLKVRRGGAAVVLGALSPRVRNAQVAMYQAGEVDFIVATDAIGMGLNLDIEHVALAGDTKFDGRETRQLEVTELAQIVGRAGRYLRDGTFGTLSPLPGLSERTSQQLEGHRFADQRTAYYRNAKLDFVSLDTLVRSLEVRPVHSALRAAAEGDDMLILRALRGRPEIHALCHDPAKVALLWDLCRIPNYEKHIPEHQAERLWPLFEQLVERGQLCSRFLDEQLRRLERYEGDIDQLLARLSGVRTWLYICHQRGWVEQAASWQERTRALEDKLGDLLHEHLIARFVNARAGSRGHALRPGARACPAHSKRDVHHPFAKLSVWPLAADAGGGGATRAQRSSCDELGDEQRWVESLVAAPYSAFELSAKAELSYAGSCVARLVRGKTLLSPALRPQLPDWLEPGARTRVERRLQAHLKDVLAHLLEPLSGDGHGDSQLLKEQASAPLRGLLYQLEQNLGSVSRRDVAEQLQQLGHTQRRALARWNIRVGQSTVYAHDMLDAARLSLRAALCHVWQGLGALNAQQLHETLWTLEPGMDRQLCMRLGFMPLARWGVRCDRLEDLLNSLATLPPEDPARLTRTRLLLGCSEVQATSLLRSLPQRRRARRRRRRGAASTPRLAATSEHS